MQTSVVPRAPNLSVAAYDMEIMHPDKFLLDQLEARNTASIGGVR